MTRPTDIRAGLPGGALLAAVVLAAALLGAGRSADAERPAVGARVGEPAARVREARAALPAAAHRVAAFLDRERPGLLRGAFSRPGARLPDFTGFADVQRRKQEFFAWMLPLVDQENTRLRAVRRRLVLLFDRARLGWPLDEDDRRWLADLAAEFRIPDADPAAPEFWQAALDRVDALPAELVLVQAANESAWGTSRFAREGNNLFGQWCFRPGCGIVPLDRPAGASYEVARFGSPAESVGSYMRNLNTGRSYRLLRRIRARHRAEGRPPVAADLAAGLVDYSERGHEYVAEIRAMLRVNTPVIAGVRGAPVGAADAEG